MFFLNWLVSFRKRFQASVQPKFPARVRRRTRELSNLAAMVELLEPRRVLTPGSFYQVTGLTEGAGVLGSGDGTQANPFQYTTLRGAIAAATADGGPDTVTFDTSLVAGSFATITLSTVGDTTIGPSDLKISTNITIQGRS